MSGHQTCPTSRARASPFIRTANIASVFRHAAFILGASAIVTPAEEIQHADPA
jgi:hypothetical protein